MGKLKIRNCTRCKKGEVFIDRDQFGWYECCLQCGYTRDLPDITQPAAGNGDGYEQMAVPVRRTRGVR